MIKMEMFLLMYGLMFRDRLNWIMGDFYRFRLIIYGIIILYRSLIGLMLLVLYLRNNEGNLGHTKYLCFTCLLVFIIFVKIS